MGGLLKFAKERAGSLISKKLGAAVIAETSAIGTPLQGYPLMVYILAQALTDAFKYWVDSQKA